MTGFSLVPELQAVPGIGKSGCTKRQTGSCATWWSGRLDFGDSRPPFGGVLRFGRGSRVEDPPGPPRPDPAFPIMSTKYNSTMAVRKEATHLADAINAEIGEMWEGCTNQRILLGTA